MFAITLLQSSSGNLFDYSSVENWQNPETREREGERCSNHTVDNVTVWSDATCTKVFLVEILFGNDYSRCSQNHQLSFFSYLYYPVFHPLLKRKCKEFIFISSFTFTLESSVKSSYPPSSFPVIYIDPGNGNEDVENVLSHLFTYRVASLCITNNPFTDTKNPHPEIENTRTMTRDSKDATTK